MLTTNCCLLVGVNHHFKTTIFGVALLFDNRHRCSPGCLRNYMDYMGWKHPQVVVIDGQLLMMRVINKIFLQAIHCLCAWHLNNNAANHVSNGEFKIQFTKLMYYCFTEKDFEEQWRKLITNIDLQENEWALEMYENISWEETFFRCNFFGEIRTT